MIFAKTRSEVPYYLGILGFGFVLCIPLIFSNVFSGDDLADFHLIWVKHFSEQFWHGDLYPRWLQNMNAGLGSPTFFFYPPASYYFTAFLYPLFQQNPAWYALKISAALALIFSGITAFIWLKTILKINNAFVASLVYLLLPYHYIVDLYCRFAFAEHWAFVWMPLVLYFTKKIVDGSRLAVVGCSLSYALLILTHMPTVITFSALPVLYAIYQGYQKKKLNNLLPVILSLVIGIGLATIYWFPAMTMQDYINLEKLWQSSTKAIYIDGFLFAFLVDKVGYLFMSLLVTLSSLFALAIASLAYLLIRNNKNNLSASLQQESTFWFGMTIASFLIMLPISKPAWDLLPILQKIQFPFRFSAILVLSASVLLGICLELVQQPLSSKFSRWSFKALIFSIIGLFLLGFPFAFMRTQKLVSPAYLSQVVDVSLDQQHLPKQVSGQFMYGDYFRRALQSLQETKGKFPQVKLTAGEGVVEIKQWNPRKIKVKVNTTTNSELMIKQYYYPLWKANLQNSDLQLSVEQTEEPKGWVKVAVPGGINDNLLLTMPVSKQERLAQNISQFFAVVTTIIVIFYSLKALRKHQ